MPLLLNTLGSERPKRIVWDPQNAKEVHEAGLQTRRLLSEGWTSGDTTVHQAETEGEVVLYPPQQKMYLGIMRVLDESGDRRIVWDRRDARQVKEAFQKFKEFRSQGYRAYTVRSDGSRGSKLEEFDSLLEEILIGKQKVDLLLVPPTIPG